MWHLLLSLNMRTEKSISSSKTGHHGADYSINQSETEPVHYVSHSHLFGAVLRCKQAPESLAVATILTNHGRPHEGVSTDSVRKSEQT